MIEGNDWVPNGKPRSLLKMSIRYLMQFPVIPDYAKMRWIVRAPSYAELADLVRRVKACIE